MAAEGWVSEIQPFSVHDGEGIRTTVFLAGCPLRCAWCANPETWAEAGERMTVAQVVDRVMRHRVFFRASGGGVTFSGGEATAQPAFLLGLMDAFEAQGVDLALETACTFSWDRLGAHMPRFGRIYADLKHLDDGLHRRYTGQGSGLVLENLKRLGALGPVVTVRLPLVPGVNDARPHLEAVARFMGLHLPDSTLEILPYHALGAGKYAALGLPPPVFAAPAPEALAAARALLEARGVAVVSWL